MLGRCPDWPETELLGLVSEALGLDLKPVMLCETPGARVNCSRNSTLVRPLAGNAMGWVFSKRKTKHVENQN